MMNQKTECKRVADSATENAKIVQSKDINGQNRLFGGRLMEWIDETAPWRSRCLPTASRVIMTRY